MTSTAVSSRMPKAPARRNRPHTGGQTYALRILMERGPVTHQEFLHLIGAYYPPENAYRSWEKLRNRKRRAEGDFARKVLIGRRALATRVIFHLRQRHLVVPAIVNGKRGWRLPEQCHVETIH